MNMDANATADPGPKKIDECDSLDLDELLPQIGEFGKYQKLLLFLICLPACVPCGFCAFNQLFMAATPQHWCYVPELMNLDQELRRKLIAPIDNAHGSLSKCKRYDVNYTEILTSKEFSDINPNSSWPVINCDKGWEYDTTQVESSVVIDFDLVCDRAIYPTLGLVALNAGGLVGVYAFGWLSDRFGRRSTYFTCLATLLVGSVLTSVSRDFRTWAASRAIVGLTIPAVYQIPFIIALELVGPKYRAFVTVLTCTFYTFGVMILAGVTYYIRDWTTMSLATSVPFISFFLYAFFLPESPRWLLANGKLNEALTILQTLASVNKRTIPESFLNRLQNLNKLQVKQKEKQPGALSLCKTPNMRLKTILITLNWFANETVYIGLSYYGPQLGSDPYVSFLLASLVEIPSYVVCWFLMDKWGRRWPLCLGMILAGILSSITVLLPADAVITTLVLYLLAKSAISASFLIIYPFAGELYPTQVRGVGIGTSSYIGGLGLIAIPFITYLGVENLILPLVIMGAVSIFGGIAGLRLPETLHQKLPQTLEEGEAFGSDWSVAQCTECIPKRIKPVESINDSLFGSRATVSTIAEEYHKQISHL
ncbi:carcinine transporter [Ctenocephalides felis]|uniref:carcinine transporter n=1 Tax=Ctenocephalides felis TaxID=7515 RepID=UPI000E6E201A|nr:carcinine transporter [Ctenocephalides felis]